MLLIPGNGERGTGNGERGTGNGERGTGNGERGTGNGERGTGNGERGTGNGERGTGNGERGTGNGERGTGNGERGTGNGEPGTGNREPGTGVWELVYSGNPLKNAKWRTTEKKRLEEYLGKREFPPAVSTDDQYALVRTKPDWHWNKQSMQWCLSRKSNRMSSACARQQFST